MGKNLLETVGQLDAKFLEKVVQDRDSAFQEGVLPRKTKYLIAMALDAAHGASGGVASLARQALQHGAAKEEIVETLRIAYYISGVGSVYTASVGLEDIL